MDHQQVVSSLSPTAADDDGAANCTTTTELSSADPDVDLMTAPAVVKEAPCDTSSKNIDTTGRVVAAVNGHAKPAVVGAPNYTTKTCLNGDEHEEKEDERCGWGPFRPQFCQRFRNAKVVLLFLCILATIQVNAESETLLGFVFV